jgi:hypothetical protein
MACVTVIVDNQNGSVPASGNTLFLTLFGAGQPATLVTPKGSTFSVGQSMAFEDLLAPAGGDAQFVIQTPTDNPLAGGRLYFSETDLGGNQPPANASYRYDYVEFTIVSTAGVTTVNGDVTGIDQVGIPAQMAFQDATGRTLNQAGSSAPAVRSMGCWTTILDTFTTNSARITEGWTTTSIEVKNGSNRIRLAGPSNMPGGIAQYPSMQGYVTSLAGSTVTVSGYFGGNTKPPLPAAYYSYSGTFDASGNLALRGTLTSDKAGTAISPSYPDPKTMYLPARGFFDTMAPNGWWDSETWGNAKQGYATGYGVYAQNGPYQLGGTAPATFETRLDAPGGTPTSLKSWALDATYLSEPSIYYNSIGNDIYGWIYGDLVASLGNGFVGPLGYATSAWNTNGDATGTPYAKPQKAFSDLYPGGAPAYAAWDLFQQAIATTSDSYGMSLGDRFDFAEAKSSSPDMATDQQTGVIRVTVLPDDGCSAPVSLAPSPQSLVLTTAGTSSTDSVIVLPAGQQPPKGVFHDYVTPTAVGFAPLAYSLDKRLPAGLDFDAATGVISGSPTATQARTPYTITATDGTRTASAIVYVTVGDAVITPAVQSVDGVVGSAVTPTQAFTPSGFDGDPTYSVTPALPVGLTLDPDTGVVSGTPTAAMLPTPFTVTATDSDGDQATATITIEVTDGSTLVPVSQQVSGSVGQPLSPSVALRVQPAGAVSGVTFQVAPVLPAGLSLDGSTGVISGTPQQAQAPTMYAITATGTTPDGGTSIAHAAVQLTVAAGTPSPTPSPTGSPSVAPSASPSASPTPSPTAMPTPAPSASPTATPSPSPSPTPSPTTPPAPAACPTGTVLIHTAVGPVCASIA